MADGPLGWEWLGDLGYAEALARQLEVRAAVLDELRAGGDGAAAGRVLLCQHPPVITLGRSADRRNVLLPEALLAEAGVTVHAIERGGDVTYHGPGQLMIYAVLRIRRGVVDFLARVAAELGAVAAELGVPGAAWQRDPAGLWLDGAKLAACGIHVMHGVVTHGYAFNVATPPEAWRVIRPCGLDSPVVSLAAARAARGLPPVTVAEVALRVGPRLAAALAG